MLALVVTVLAQSILNTNRQDGVAFYAEWVGAKAVASEGSAAALYDADGRRRVAAAGLAAARLDRHPQLVGAAEAGRHRYGPGHVTVATPFAYRLYRLFSTDEYVYDLVRFQVLSTLGWLMAMVLLCSAFGATEGVFALLLLWALTLFAPMRADQGFGEQGRLLVTLLAFAAAQWTAKPRLSNAAGTGLLLGLIVAFHPMLFAVPALLLLAEAAGGRRERARWLAGGLAGGLAFGLLVGTVGFARVGDWWLWGKVVLGDGTAAVPLGLEGHSLQAISDAWLGFVPPSLTLPALAVAGAAVVRFREVLADPARAMAVALTLGTAVELLGSGQAQLYSFLLLTPGVVYLLRRRARPRVQVLGVVGFGLAAGPFAIAKQVFPMGLWERLSQPVPTALAAQLGVVVVVAALILDLVQGPRAEETA